MKITAVNLYTVEPEGSDYGPGVGERWDDDATERQAEPPLVPAHPMSVFPEYKHSDVADWRGPYAYGPFVVELETDAGTSGFCVNHGGGDVACRIIRDWLRDFVVGKSPFDTALVWEQMHRAQLPVGHGGLEYMAISAVDLAMWDLKAKILERPVYDLIGGRTKDAVPCYVTTFPGTMHHMVNQGFGGVKLSCPWGVADGRRGIVELDALVDRTRQLFGTDIPLMLEAYMGWDVGFTVQAAERLRRYEIDWIEDPLPGDASVRQYGEVRTAIKPTRLAVGNLMWGETRFASLISERAADVIQPELQWAGGMTAALRIAAMSRGQGLPIIPHWAGAYSYHFTMAHPEAPIAEYVAPGDGTKVIPKGHVIIGEPAPSDGHITLTDEPGFGIELNRDVIEPYG